MPENHSQKNYKLLFYFILAWIAVNVLQACFTGVDGDEAYYWIYSQHLQWGYFDHPPMVALTIKLGEWFGHGYFFTRAGTILLSASTIYFGFQSLPGRLQNTKHYILFFSSVVLFHVYGFVVTPDAPLLFFTALFFYAYKQYLKQDKISTDIFLCLSIVGLLYSKYQGVLPLFFTFLSNPKLVFKKSAWIIVGIAALAFLPHILWQYHHNWPTFRYHLFERNQESYHIDQTINYVSGQLLIWGPFTTIVAFIFFFKKKSKQEIYYKAHVFTFFGVLLFFLANSFKKHIEVHWTLVGGISFLVLVMDLIEQSSQRFRKIFLILCGATFLLIMLARLIIVIPDSPAKNIDRFRVQIYSRSWADSVYKYAKGVPVVFIDQYSHAAIYKYHHPDELTESFSTVYYRKTNFSLQNEQPFNNKTVYIVSGGRTTENDTEVKNNYHSTFLHKLDSFKAITGLHIKWLNQINEGEKEKKIKATIELFNPLQFSIRGTDLFLNYSFSKLKTQQMLSENIPVNEKELWPGYKKDTTIEMQLPPTAGKYRLIFSFNEPFTGPTLASPFYEIEIK